MKLTKRQKEVLSVYWSFDKIDVAPLHEEVSDVLNISASGVSNHATTLWRKGFLDRQDRRSRRYKPSFRMDV